MVHQSILHAWQARVTLNPGRAAIRYFDGALSAADVDRQSDAISVGLAERGVGPGDRVGVYLQNTPYYPLSLLGIWKAGAIAVPLNPMYKGEELRRLVDDSGAAGVIATAQVRDEAARTLAGTAATWVIGASDRAFQTRDDPRVIPADEPAPPDELGELIKANEGQAPRPVEIGPDDTAFITYTSGTTGPPKGALNSHANFLHSAGNYAEWVDLQPGDVVFAIAPLFHITGITLNLGISLLTDTTLVLAGRFNAAVTLDAFAEHGVTFTIGSITAFNAFFTVPGAGKRHFESVKCLYSGGAPIPPSTVARFQEQFGPYLHNIYGMTETTAGLVAVPLGAEAPVDPRSGTLSVGKAMQNVQARVITPAGEPAPPGQEGELELVAPQVVSGYWQNPEATAHTMPGGRLRTGDVAVIDDDGWIYLVDRLKDQINASGFKVWPREVEDVLYQHDAVYEAAVVGEPDEYRGETVVAYVSLKDGATATPDELIAFSRERLAAYKYPRKVHIVAELPKTATGKIQRKELRDGGPLP